MPEFAAPRQPARKPHDRHGVTPMERRPALPKPGHPLDGDTPLWRAVMEAGSVPAVIRLALGRARASGPPDLVQLTEDR